MAGETRESLSKILETNAEEVRNLVWGDFNKLDNKLIEDGILLTDIYFAALKQVELKPIPLKSHLKKLGKPESPWGKENMSLGKYLSSWKRAGIRQAHKHLFPERYEPHQWDPRKPYISLHPRR
tara:strand:- start:5931 stop:6302 length:372 start_codon:yes stop_codon:yes gene_type:complete